MEVKEACQKCSKIIKATDLCYCGGCVSTIYCSRDCQRDDRLAHLPACFPNPVPGYFEYCMNLSRMPFFQQCINRAMPNRRPNLILVMKIENNPFVTGHTEVVDVNDDHFILRDRMRERNARFHREKGEDDGCMVIYYNLGEDGIAYLVQHFIQCPRGVWPTG